MKAMKNYVKEISMETADKVITMATELNILFDGFDGTLLDNYIVYNDSDTQIKFGRSKPRKYIIIEEFYKNCWTSGLRMTCTDDDKLADEFLERHETFEEEEILA